MTTPTTETRKVFLHRIADFLEAHSRDEGGYSDATRKDFTDDATRLREIAGPVTPPREIVSPFTKGQRVVVQVGEEPSRAGVIAHASQRADWASVLLDGRKTTMTYHVNFIRPEPS